MARSTDSTSISTPYGDFIVTDVRTPDTSNRDFVSLTPIGGSYTVNRKTYEGHLRLVRGYGSFYVSRGYDALSDSAQAKLEEAFEVLNTEYPPLTHAEKVEHVKGRAVDGAVRAVERLMDVVNDAVRDADMGVYSNRGGDDRDRLTDAETAEISAAVRAVIRERVAATI